MTVAVPARPLPVILLVEDDTVAGTVFGQVLQAHGCAIRIAADAEAAIAELGREVPAAVVIDLHLPTGDGRDLLRRIRSIGGLATLPAAVITGDYFVEEALVHDLETLGAHVYFKPLWEDDFMSMVAALLAGPSTRPPL